MFGQGGGQQRGEGHEEVDEREGEGAVFEAGEHAVVAGEGGEGQELDEHAEGAVDGEEEADARGLEDGMWLVWFGVWKKKRMGRKRGGGGVLRQVATYVEAETAGEFEGKAHVGVCGPVGLFGMVHEDREELVATDGVEG